MGSRAAPRWIAAGIVRSVPKPNRPSATQPREPRLLSGGNPQISKGDGDEIVQAYIGAMPQWKREVGRAIDDLVSRTHAKTPGFRKAVRWNTPFYGIEDRGWFLGFHCMTQYVKVAFLNGTALTPMPPVESKNKGTRYLHIHEGEPLDGKQWKAWLAQAAQLPGERLF